MAKISLAEMSEAVEEIIVLYSESVELEMQEAAKKVAKEAVKELKATSPKRRPAYYSGWTSTIQKKAAVIHNKKYPGLTHLLEKGHMNRDGSRTATEVHIAPVEQKAIKEFVRLTKEAIQK